MTRFILAGLAVAVTAMAADVSSSAPSAVTFTKDVLPVLQRNCQTCHRPGQVAPMSLLTYQDARPWAKAIKAAVTARKMPPWFADPNYGHFLNDRSLKPSGRRCQGCPGPGSMAKRRLGYPAGGDRGSSRP